jgi:hypothetical protein
MRPQGHLAGGIIAAAALDRPLWLGAACATLPDLDLLLAPVLRKSKYLNAHFTASEGHHYYPTHTPIFWGLVYLGMGPHKETAKLIGIAVATHLISDMVSDEIPILWPLSRRQVGLRWDRDTDVRSKRDYVLRHPRNKTWRIECLLIAGAAVISAAKVIKMKRQYLPADFQP